MLADSYDQIPPEDARRLWQSSLERVWKLYGQAIPGAHQLHQIPWSDAVDFGSVLGAATTDDAVIQAIKANPKAASTFLLYATRLDEHFDHYSDQFYPMSVSLSGDKIPPFLMLASSVQDTMQREIEKNEQAITIV